MARVLTPQDAHAIINAVAEQATGQNTITATNTSSFVSVGEMILATGMENTMQALSLVLGRTMAAVRPYDAKFNLVNAVNTGAYSHRFRKISYYADDALPSGDWNTQLFTNLADGYDNGSNGGASTASQWEQHVKYPLELNFGGSSVWETCLTLYPDQIKQAFRDEASFNTFVSGILTEHGNDVEQQKEAFNRITVLNHIAAVYDMDALLSMGRVVNLTAAYNAKFNPSPALTTQELLTDHLSDFLKFFISQYKIYSRRMTYRSIAYHHFPLGPNGRVLMRHTPPEKQRFMCYAPFWEDARARVMPEIFRPEYLQEPRFEAVDFWQSFDAGPEINITPAIPDFDSTSPTYKTQIAGSAVNLTYVLGILFDEDAIMTDFQMERANVTSLEARKNYRNSWLSFAKNAINDLTENSILFIMDDNP